MKNIIFLDIDGVLNSQLFYKSEQFKNYLKSDKSTELDINYYMNQISKECVLMLNDLCEETESVVVISSTWRSGRTVEELQEILDACGATFKIIGKTPHDPCRVRGVEIKQWLEANCLDLFGVNDFDFYRYAIIDDDSDMLLNQQFNFFHVDNHTGLTPNTCYKIRRFFLHKTF